MHLKWPWKRIFSSIFLLSFPLFLSFFFFSFVLFGEWGQEMGTREAFFFSPLSFLFVSFLPFFLLFLSSFLYFFLFRSGKWRMKISLSLPSFLLFKREKWEDQLEKIEGNSLSFSFLFSVFFLSFDPSSFQFLGGGMDEWNAKKVCPNRAKKILQEHSSF